MQRISAMLLLIAALGVAKPGWAQDACPGFAEAAGLSEQQFEVLATSRAISVERMEAALLGDMGAIGAYLSVPSTPSDAGPRALAYYVAAGESVCLYYLSSQGNEQSFQLSTSAVALRALVDETLVAVSDAAAPLERRAQLRDGVQASRAAKSLARDTRPPADPAPLLGRLAEVLFPEGLRDEVERLSGLTIVPALNIGTVPFAGLDPNGDGSPLAQSTSINVEAALRDSGLPAEALELELTDSVLMDHAEAVLLRLDRLRAGIIELAGLTYDDRTSANDEDRGDVGSFGHELMIRNMIEPRRQRLPQDLALRPPKDAYRAELTLIFQRMSSRLKSPPASRHLHSR